MLRVRCLTPVVAYIRSNNIEKLLYQSFCTLKRKLWKNKLFTKEDYQGREPSHLLRQEPTDFDFWLYHWLESDEDSSEAAARKAASRNEVNRRREN